MAMARANGARLGSVGAALVLALAACSSSATVAPTTVPTGASTTAPTEAPSATPIEIGSAGTIGVQVPINNEFTQCFSTGAIHAANAAGYAVKIKQSGFQDPDVLVDFDAFIAEGVKGIVVLPQSDQSSSQGTIAADAAKIPVANAGWFSETPADAIWVGRLKVDVAAGAKLIADWIGKNTQPAEVVFVSGAPGLPTNVAFEDALGPAIDALDGDWKLVGTEAGFYTRDGAITAIENLMTAHPAAKIVVALSADMADGVVTWMKNNSRTDITLISGDSDLALIKNMKDGNIKADLYWGSAEQGASAMGLLLDFLANGTKHTEITAIPISIDTVDTIDATTQARPICYEDLLAEAQKME